MEIDHMLVDHNVGSARQATNIVWTIYAVSKELVINHRFLIPQVMLTVCSYVYYIQYWAHNQPAGTWRAPKIVMYFDILAYQNNVYDVTT